MKVPIEVEGEEPMDKDEQATQAAAEQDVAEEPVAQEIDPDGEQALIDAAKRSLEAAEPAGGDEDASILARIEARAAAKREKNYAEADRIRAELLAEGITLIDTKDGTTYTKA